MDLILTSLCMAYGVLLIVANFVSNRFTEMFRIDALLVPHPTDKTRWLNLLAGLAVIGYNAYILLGN